MTVSEGLKPKRKLVLMGLLKDAGLDVRHWADYKGKHPSKNPKYCYNWSFEQSGEFVAVCLWYADLLARDGTVVYERKASSGGVYRGGPGANVTNAREASFIEHLALAYHQQLPVKVIIVDGEPREAASEGTGESPVDARALDNVDWAVASFNELTGACTLVRGAKPTFHPIESPDDEASYFEGPARKGFIIHRQREASMRRKKISDALKVSGGKLMCEVSRCGFDFAKVYGALGAEYAHVHHLIPLSKSPAEGRKAKLSELAIVCANCHAMIHRGGKCRPLAGLIP